MKVELLALCDGAFNYNGKLTIVGALSDYNASTVPTKINIGLALKIRLDANENIEGGLKIVFYNPDETVIPVDINVDLTTKTTPEMSYISLAADIQGVPITQYGCHHVKVYLMDECLSDYSFKVIEKR